MGVWLSATGAPGAINLAQVAQAAILSSVPGNVRFTFVNGTTTDIAMGTSEAEAADALRRLVDAVDPADYSS